MLLIFDFQKLSCQLCCAKRTYSSLSGDKKKRVAEGPGLSDFIEASLNGGSVGENIIQKRGERLVLHTNL